MKLLELLLENFLVESKGQAKRLVTQRAIKVNDKTIKDLDFDLELNKAYLISIGNKELKINLN